MSDIEVIILYSIITLKGNDRYRFWSIELDKENARYRSHYGYCDILQSNSNRVHPTGSVISTNWITSEPKHVGKSNEVNAQNQAVNEVKSKINMTTLMVK